MKINDFATVFHGSVDIVRTIHTTTRNGIHSVRFETLYSGNLAQLTDNLVLDKTISVIENIEPSTTRGKFLKISVL